MYEPGKYLWSFLCKGRGDIKHVIKVEAEFKWYNTTCIETFQSHVCSQLDTI